MANQNLRRRRQKRTRYSDEQLYAFAQYIYSLKPPPNPESLRCDRSARQEDLRARRLRGVPHAASLHEQQADSGGRIHAPAEDQQAVSRFSKSVWVPIPGMRCRREKEQGITRCPSLKGVWYRGPFEHNGSVATLEDWFDPARFRQDYVPTG